MLITPTTLSRRWRLKPATVLHIGAHRAEEILEYDQNGWGSQRTLWVEAIPQLAQELTTALAGRTNHRVIHAVAWDRVETVSFRVTSSTMSSSALPLKLHSAEYPSISEASRFDILAQPLEHLLHGDPVLESIDFINLDIQGAELRALRGLGTAIQTVKAIYSEINIVELYEGCALLPDIVAFLRENGFALVDIRLTSSGWGDALFLRRDDVAPLRLLVQRWRVRGRILVSRLRKAVRPVARPIRLALTR